VSSADQFADVMLGTRGGVPIRIRDVAQVEDGAAERRTWSALSKGNSGKDVVAIDVLRQSGPTPSKLRTTSAR
jgi:multidrug efflux pump